VSRRAVLPDARRRAVTAVLGRQWGRPPARAVGAAYAPANVALVKYWGKRDEVLNLPNTDSLSLSLGPLGTWTSIRPSDRDRFRMNGRCLAANDPACTRLRAYLDLFRGPECPAFEVESRNTVPTAAGVASSASAYASIAIALDMLFGWRLAPGELSVLARLGSGSAARSIALGFVRWRRGRRSDGLDSRAEPLSATWPGLRVGLWMVRRGAKAVGSREAMRRCGRTSPLYAAWPATVAADLREVLAALRARDLERLGTAAEGNALAMHATMIAARPPVIYWTGATLRALAEVAALRREGVAVWATMDAGPNLKLLFEVREERALRERIPALRIVDPWDVRDAGAGGAEMPGVE